MSLTASYVILFVILVRLLLKKVPKVISYALWGVVAFRLLCPFSFESMFSLLPANATPIPNDIAYQQSPQINSGIIAVDTYVNRALPYSPAYASVNPLQIYIQIGSYIWILGIALMLVYSVASVLILKSCLKSSQHIDRNIYEANNLKTPFVLGIFRPKIYIPAGLAAEEKSHIIRHEQMHIRRFDHIVKPFAFFTLSIHWFNPLVWIAFLLMSNDMEYSCDEKVIKEMGGEIKKAYSASLLSLAMGKRILNGSPLAFGEGNVKGRIKNVLNYRKPAFWVITVAVIAVIALGIGLLSNPRQDVSLMDDSSFPGEPQLDNIVSVQADQPLTFSSDETDLSKLGTIAFDTYMCFLKSEKTPVNERIASYKLNDISVLAGNINEFCVSLNYDFSTDSDSYMNPGFGAKGKGTWPDNYLEIRVEHTGGDTYTIIGVGTGGGGQGLSPVEDSVSYGLAQLRNGEILRAILPLSGDNAQLAKDVIMDQMIKSAAWPGVDIKALDECYLLRATYSDGTLTDYYAYLLDGKAVMQRGADGFYSRINNDLYEKLVKLAHGSTVTVGSVDGIERTNLDACVADAILTANIDQYHNGDFTAEAHTVLKTVESGSTTTVYAMALYMEFGYAGSGFFETGGSHMPVAITFEKNAVGEYEFKEYWTPQDGSDYALSIKKKFPSDIYKNALDTQKYVVAHIQACYAQAVEYGSVPVAGHLAKLVETICSSPAEASNPWVYIDAHPIEYREMIYYGSYTLRYCFTRFEMGGENGLDGHIMALACRKILGNAEDDVLTSTGQEWYNAFKESAKKMRQQKGDDYMEKNMPGSWLLLQMPDESMN